MPASPEPSATETGWLADFIYRRGVFETGLAMFSDANGRITRFSRDGDDLARSVRLPNCAILPGLVNVHSHAFQRVIRGRTEHRTAARRDTFWTWRESMYHAANQLTPEDMYHAARMAFLEMVLSGITTVGEFHYVHHGPGGMPYADRNKLAFQVLRAADEIGLRIALLRTAYVRAGWQKSADPGQARFISPCAQHFIADTEALRAALPGASRPARAWIGIAPHSIRAVPLEYLREVASFTRANDLPLHMHVAEQPAEVEACLAEYGQRPVELLHKQGILDSRFTAIHAIHITSEEINFLAETRARVCACPTTERNLGDGTSPADRLLGSGVGICFGSDSNVQIDLLEDARALEYHLRMNQIERVVLATDSARDGLAKRLFDCATETGAQSLAAPGGKLEIGRAADFFTVDLSDPSIAGARGSSLLNHIVFSLERTAIRDVAVGGEFVIRDGRHRLQDEIVRNFDGVQKTLWGSAQ
ncbi:MAG TPA: formimidoylglutamate deiminase [Bryobacteraceae bacterium]|jgi:formimidoylglutamate deiminase|nr:formimidoylglutamate deiminase [Bryobacteraceae bacterium]